MQYMSIVITGNPGVGKHTVAKALSEKMQLDIIDINQIAEKSGLFEKNEKTNDVDTRKLKRILENILEKNSLECIIVGHLAPYVLDKNQIKIAIILRRDPYDLIKVYRERQYTEEKSRENTGSEILGVITHDAINQFGEKTIQINTSDKEIKGIVEKIESSLLGKIENEEIDWLKLVTKNDDLKKFFVD